MDKDSHHRKLNTTGPSKSSIKTVSKISKTKIVKETFISQLDIFL